MPRRLGDDNGEIRIRKPVGTNTIEEPPEWRHCVRSSYSISDVSVLPEPPVSWHQELTMQTVVRAVRCRAMSCGSVVQAVTVVINQREMVAIR